MNIRKTNPNDLLNVMAIYERARSFMAANGNPNQCPATPADKIGL